VSTNRKTNTLITIGFVGTLALLALVNHNASSAIKETRQTRTDYQAMTETNRAFIAELKALRETTVKVELINLPPTPSVAYTVTMPPEEDKKKRDRRL